MAGGERYLVGDQRLRTGEFYSLIADISHTQRPKFEVVLNRALLEPKYSLNRALVER